MAKSVSTASAPSGIVPDRRFKHGDSFSFTITDGVDTAAATVTATVQPKSGGGRPGGK
jgi:hypothetical protein